MSSNNDKIGSSEALSSKDTQLLLGWWFILTVAGCVVLWQALPENTPRLLSVFDAFGIITGTITSVFTIVAVCYAYIKRESLLDSFKNRMARPEFHNTGHPFEEKVDAVIIPVSDRGTEQPDWIIRHLKPRFVALVCSQQSAANGESLIEEFSGLATFINDPVHLKTQVGEILSNPRDPQEVKNLAKCFIAEILRRGISRHKIFVDTTGGLVPMSIGLFQGAEEEGVSTIYINGLIKNPQDVNQGDPIFMSDRTPDAHIT